MEPWALKFAEEWIAAWNSHDLDRILAHYADDLEISSPLIVERMNEPSGTLRGKAAVRAYWAKGLALPPPIKFELLAVHAGVNRLGLVYRSVGRRFGIEILHAQRCATRDARNRAPRRRRSGGFWSIGLTLEA